MPVLDNAKHELFAQGLAQGKNATDAHEAAGYKRNDGNASALANTPSIQARVKEIKGVAAERIGVTVEAILAELARLGFSNMLDYLRIGPDGLPYTDFSALTRDQAAAIAEVHVETTTAARDEGGEELRPEVKKVRFKLADKRGALVDLGKHLGLFKERIEHTGKDGGPIEIGDGRERLARLLDRLADAGAKGKGAR